MKRSVLTTLMIVIISMSICACGKSEAVVNTEQLINNIGEVTLDSEEVIVMAEDSYSQLSASDANKVDNYNLLLEARNTYDRLLTEWNSEIDSKISEAESEYELAELSIEARDLEGATSHYQRAQQLFDELDGTGRLSDLEINRGDLVAMDLLIQNAVYPDTEIWRVGYVIGTENMTSHLGDTESISGWNDRPTYYYAFSSASACRRGWEAYYAYLQTVPGITDLRRTSDSSYDLRGWGTINFSYNGDGVEIIIGGDPNVIQVGF